MEKAEAQRIAGDMVEWRKYVLYLLDTLTWQGKLQTDMLAAMAEKLTGREFRSK